MGTTSTLDSVARRRWFKLNLRTIVVVIPLVVSTLGLFIHRGLSQKHAIEYLRLRGASLHYARIINPETPSAWDKLAAWIGWDFFTTVDEITFSSDGWIIESDGSRGLDALRDRRSSRIDPLPQIFGDEDVARLRDLRNLRKITFNETRLTDRGLAEVGRVSSLREIDITCVSSPKPGDIEPNILVFGRYLTPSGLTSLNQLPRLQVLTVNIQWSLEDDLKFLSGFDQLEELNLYQHDAPGNWLAHLPEMKRLRTIMFPHQPIGEIDDALRAAQDDMLAELCRFPSLETVDLTDHELHGHGLAHLACLPKLTELRVSPRSLKPGWFQHLAKLKQLKHLRPDARISWLENLEPLEKLTSLECVTLSYYDFWKGINELHTLPHLKRVELFDDHPGVRTLDLVKEFFPRVEFEV